MRSFAECPVVAPYHPRGFGQRLAELCLLPFAVIDADFDSGDAARTGVGDTADGQHHVAVFFVHLVDRHCVDNGGHLHDGIFRPAARNPVTFVPVFDHFNVDNPLGLFHAVAVGDPDAQRVAVFGQQRLTVPFIGQHDARVLTDEIE